MSARYLAIVACVLCGCWPWHRGPTQQQQFIEALNRGNGAEANQIWQHMDAESRAGFAHSEGMHPVQGAASSDEIKRRIAQHYAEKLGMGEDEANVEEVVPHAGAGGLESLPEYTGPTGSMPQTVTVPGKND